MNFDTIRLESRVLVKEALATKNVGPLLAKQKLYNRPDADVKTPFDQVFKDLLLDYIVDETNIGVLEDLITLSIESSRKGVTNLALPVNLLADIFDLFTLDSCEKMFSYVERHVNVLKEDLFFQACKNNLLRMCNDLLRRLSRSTATIFCGRILLFLAKFFPFSERSGLNVVSEFNLDNVTEYGSENIVMVTSKDEKKKPVLIDYNLYCKFWSLQDFFRNPTQCYNRVHWKVFCNQASCIISTFQGLKLEHLEKAASYTIEEDGNKEKIPYFSKYLTNQKLLDLQLYDVNFRRFVLMQFLILFQYLTSTVRFKSETYELKPDQKEVVQDYTDKIYQLLKETPPDGEKFAEIVKNILNREEHWNAWKNDGCPEFKKVLSNPVSEVYEKRESKVPLGDILKDAYSNGVHYMGNTELTKLWNLYPNNLDACKAKDRDFLPTLDSYFAEAIEQLNRNEPSLLRDGNFGWRALRLMARRSPHFFTLNPISELHSYLEMMVRKIVADKPGVVQENEQTVEIETNVLLQPDESAEDMKAVDGDDTDENYIRFKFAIVRMTQFHSFCEKLSTNWKTLALKLGYKQDEIQFIETQNTEAVDQARNLLHLWFEDDDDSTLENFLYILEGLQFDDVAEEVRIAIEQMKSLKDF